MIIDKYGRLFGKISIVDIIVILLAVLVFAGVYVRFTGNKGKAVVKNDTFNYTLNIENVRQATLDAIDDSVNTHFYNSQKTGDDMGVLIGYEARPATRLVEKTDGTAVNAVVPDNHSITLMFEIQGKINDSGYYTSDMNKINVNSKYSIKSKYSAVEGVVTSINK